MSVINLAIYIRDLLGLPETEIKLGRDNFERTDFNARLIVVDEISSSPIAISKKFDGEAEEINRSIVMSGDFTIDFFGDTALQDSIDFTSKSSGQEGYELQRDMGIGVHTGTSRADLKKLTGSQYSPDYQLSLKLRYNESVTVPTKRIDTAETTIIAN